MNTKNYSNVLNIFDEAESHPRHQQFIDTHRARICLALLIHNKRIEKSLTIEELAEKAQTTPANIQRIENLHISVGIDLIYKIFKALEIQTLTFEFDTQKENGIGELKNYSIKF